jgi:hypothetical protein
MELVVNVSIKHFAKSGKLLNKMFYSVFTQLQYICSLATCFGFVKKKKTFVDLPIVNEGLKMV